MAETSLIRGALLWDGVSDNILQDGALYVTDKLIKAVGPFDHLSGFAHDHFYDWPGTTLVPGMIDCHTHLSMDPTLENYLDHMNDSIPELTIRAVTMMQKDLAAGVTTCRCCGDKGFLDIACRKAAEENEVHGPRLLVATRGIRASQGHGFVGYPFDGAENIKNAIHENIAAGADFIKIYITGTLKGNGPLTSYLTQDEIRLAIDESHRSGVQVAAHCVGGIGLDWALEAGLDSLEHAYHISDEQVGILAKSATRVVLTPGPILSDAMVDHLPAGLIVGHYKERDEIAGRMAAVVTAGIRYAVGTDGMHGGLVRELAYLAGLGAPLLSVLKAATIYGAEVCGIDRKTGSLEAGKEADIVAVRGNPFEDLNALKNITAVMKQGKLMINHDLH